MLRPSLLVVALLALEAHLLAQAPATAPAPEPLPVLQGRPDAPASDLLGARYESLAAGISFNTPASCRQAPRAADELARFVDPDRSWELTVSRASTDEPYPLSSSQAFKRSGLLEMAAVNLKKANNADVVQQQVIELPSGKAGVLAARFNAAPQRRLIQQAIIPANDQLYYTLTFVTPASKTATGDELDDADERLAADVFRQLLDTVRLLDRTAVKEDQDARLFRTRALFVNLNAEALRKVLVPEQWLRFMKNGKDIGYSYVIEEVDTQTPTPGIKIGSRTRTMPEADVQVDAQTWYTMSFDRRHETWSTVALMQNHKTGVKQPVTEIGLSDRQIKNVLDRAAPAGDASDPRQPAVRPTESYRLFVTTTGKNAQPFKQEVPPWYLPQAAAHLLPRLLPLHQPKTYMFASYVSDTAKVMARYIDVLPEQTVELNGQKVRAIPVSDRIGLEGAATLHYMSPAGQYLGSVNRESGITILPSDPESLQRIWANNANLTRPAPATQTAPQP